MAARPTHLCEELHRRGGAEDVGHEVADGLVGEGRQRQPAGARSGQHVQQPVQGRYVSERAERRDDCHRQVREAPGERCDGEQAGRVGPLQVVEGEHEGPVEGQRLGEVAEGVDDAVLQAGVTADGDRALFGVAVGGEQLRDGGPAGVRRGPDAAPCLDQHTERAGAFELVGPPGRNREAAVAGPVENLSE